LDPQLSVGNAWDIAAYVLSHPRPHLAGLEHDFRASQQTWAGMPVNWDWRNWNKGIWNVDDRRPFQPKGAGIGWTINLHELLRRLRVLG
jgi:hypothetical protein